VKAYLASRYSRHPEMREMRADLERLGIAVTSRWINGDHQISDDGLPAEAKAADRQRFAVEDWEDLMAADVVISFTEKPRSATNSRGGRHVEFGAALAAGKRVIVVGWRENVFHCLPQVEFFETWGECLTELANSGPG
jgi:hypothetical protein